MNKKIIAAFCIVILMISVLSACGKNKGYLQAEDSEGYVRAFVTDKNGETVLNEDGEVRVYVTNSSGEIIKDENGVPRESSVAAPKNTVNKDGSVTSGIFTLPAISGWEGTDTGKLIKKGTEGNCYIFADYQTNETKESTFALMTDKVITDNQALIDAINKGDYKDDGFAEAEMKTDRFNFHGYNAVYMSFTIFNTGNEVIHHAETIYFVNTDGEVYVVNYVCLNGVGYDASFDFLDWSNGVEIE